MDANRIAYAIRTKKRDALYQQGKKVYSVFVRLGTAETNDLLFAFM